MSPTKGASERLDDTFAALAEPNRRAVVEELRRRPRRAGELAKAVGLSPTAMSRHLRVLRTQRIIEEMRSDDDARARVYRLRLEPFRELAVWLDEVQRFWDDQLDAFTSHVGRRVREERGRSE